MKWIAALVLGAGALLAPSFQDPMKTTSAIASATQSPVPFLWFERDAEEAARFYCSIFPDSKIDSATPMVVNFHLAGRPFMALNGGPHYKLNPSFSMFVSCKDQPEVDRLWDHLLANGAKPDHCGWLVDRFGLSWQVIPERLLELMNHPDAATRDRATQAMLQMQKIDVAALDTAARAASR